MKAYQKETDDYATSPYRKMSIMLMILSVVIIISNLYGLYTRNLVVNLVSVSYTHLSSQIRTIGLHIPQEMDESCRYSES